MRNWFTITAAAGDTPADLFIYDTIDSEDVETFTQKLKLLGDCKELNVRINSYGGDAFAGVAIFNTLAGFPAQKTVYIDGIAASSASLIAMCGNRIVAPSNTFMVVHDPRALLFGSAAGHRKLASDLDSVGETFAGIYSKRSGQPVAAVKFLMSEDRLMGAAEAKAKGYVTEVTEAPAALVATFDLAKLAPQHRAAAAAFNPLAGWRQAQAGMRASMGIPARR